MTLHDGFDLVGMAGVVAALGAGLAAIRGLARQFHWTAEFKRKSVHVMMGCICAVFPWLFSGSAPVWWLAVVATAGLLAVRWLPALRAGIGSALHDVKRFSFGEVLFAPAIALVFQLAHGNPILYAIPVGILTLADTAGALVGTRWGRSAYVSGSGRKSAEGSCAFAVAALLCTALPLGLTHSCAWPQALCIGFVVALLAMMAEGFSDRGFDNLILPPAVFVFLLRLLPLEMPELLGRVVAACVLLGVVIAGARSSTLSGGALLGSALYGYGCVALADPRFVLPPLAMFFCHLATIRGQGLKDRFSHRLDAVLSQLIASYPWVLVVPFHGLPTSVALAGVSFAMATQLAISHAATRWELAAPSCHAGVSTLKGWLIAAPAGLLWLWPFHDRDGIAMASGILATLLVTWLFQRIRPCFPGDTTGLWVVRGALALLASLPAILFHA